MKGLGRLILVCIIWALTLGSADIEVKFSDGLRIHFKGWGGKKFKVNNRGRKKNEIRT